MKYESSKQQLVKQEPAFFFFSRAASCIEQYAEVGQPALVKALEDLNRALEADPQLVEAYVTKGWVLQQQGDFPSACVQYETALQIQPNQKIALLNASGVYILLGQYQTALDMLKRLALIDPMLPDLHVNLGMLSVHLGEWDEALARFNHAIELAPENANAHWNRAQLWLKKGNFEAGLPEFEWRLKLFRYLRVRSSQPDWDGRTVPDAIIAVITEGGYGDAFQFYRYLPWVKN